jgi:hypothetical protein
MPSTPTTDTHDGLDEKRAAEDAARSNGEQVERQCESKGARGFVERLDFWGALVHPGEVYHRAFSLSQECRLRGLRLVKGLKPVRIVLRVGTRFKQVAGVWPPAFEGADALVFDDVASVERSIAGKAWKDVRLVPDASAAVHLVVRNVAEDDRWVEGSWLLEADPVPTAEHDEI